MSYQGKLRVSYAGRMTSLERLRAVDDRYTQFLHDLLTAERMWEATPNKGPNELRDACTAVLAQVVGFAKDAGISSYAVSRLNDLLVALGELHNGRKSVLLSPAPVHPSGYAASDLAQQGLAQLSVDLLREAGLSASAARKKVVSTFDKHKIPRFGESKLRNLQSRLTGPGATKDEAYEFYSWAQEWLAIELRSRGLSRPLSVKGALTFVNELVRLAKERDHRHKFLFAPWGE